MTSPLKVALRVADIALIKGVVLTLGSISGDEAVALADLLTVIDPILAANGVTALTPDLLSTPVGQTEVVVEFKPSHAAMVRGQLFAKVKAFTAADIPQVVKIRVALDTAINALAEKAP